MATRSSKANTPQTSPSLARERLALVALALAAGFAIFRIALDASEDVMLALIAPVFCFLVMASLVTATDTRRH